MLAKRGPSGPVVQQGAIRQTVECDFSASDAGRKGIDFSTVRCDVRARDAPAVRIRCRFGVEIAKNWLLVSFPCLRSKAESVFDKLCGTYEQKRSPSFEKCRDSLPIPQPSVPSC